MSTVKIKYSNQYYEIDEEKIYALFKILGHKETDKNENPVFLLKKYNLYDKYFLENINKL